MSPASTSPDPETPRPALPPSCRHTVPSGEATCVTGPFSTTTAFQARAGLDRDGDGVGVDRRLVASGQVRHLAGVRRDDARAARRRRAPPRASASAVQRARMAAASSTIAASPACSSSAPASAQVARFVLHARADEQRVGAPRRLAHAVERIRARARPLRSMRQPITRASGMATRERQRGALPRGRDHELAGAGAQRGLAREPRGAGDLRRSPPTTSTRPRSSLSPCRAVGQRPAGEQRVVEGNGHGLAAAGHVGRCGDRAQRPSASGATKLTRSGTSLPCLPRAGSKRYEVTEQFGTSAVRSIVEDLRLVEPLEQVAEAVDDHLVADDQHALARDTRASPSRSRCAAAGSRRTSSRRRAGGSRTCRRAGAARRARDTCARCPPW